MSKRKLEKYAKKIKEYEEKILKHKRKCIISSDVEEGSDGYIEEVETVEPELDIVPPLEKPSDLEVPPVLLDSEYLITPTVVDEQKPDSDTDPDLLKELGNFETEVTEWGDDLQDEVAKRFQQILCNGLKKEAKDELTKQYLCPKNLSLAKAPTLNPEINTMLTEQSKNRDKRLLTKQEQLGRALSALGKALTTLLKKNADLPSVIRMLNDAGKLVADSHFTETETRRSLIAPLVDKSVLESFKERKRDNFLFGDNLGDLVKNSRGIKKTGEYMQSANLNNGTNLNTKGPSSRGRSQRAGPFYYQQRVGGPRAQSHYAGRRRAPPPPPAPPARRQAPPPPASRRPPPPPRRQPPPRT